MISADGVVEIAPYLKNVVGRFQVCEFDETLVRPFRPLIGQSFEPVFILYILAING
ncbi:hypothetical protein D3C87_1932030 [compost metagenome]